MKNKKILVLSLLIALIVVALGVMLISGVQFRSNQNNVVERNLGDTSGDSSDPWDHCTDNGKKRYCPSGGSVLSNPANMCKGVVNGKPSNLCTGPNDYFSGGQCYQLYNAVKECTDCEDGYTIIDHKCVKKDDDACPSGTGKGANSEDSSATECSYCNLGYYNDGTSGECVRCYGVTDSYRSGCFDTCPAGRGIGANSQDNSTTECSYCIGGYYNDGTSSECKKCDGPTDLTRAKCYSSGKCPAGTGYSTDSKVMCVECDAINGYYNDGTGDGYCTQCDGPVNAEGTKCYSDGVCPAGSGLYTNTSIKICSTCLDRKYNDGTSKMCKSCNGKNVMTNEHRTRCAHYIPKSSDLTFTGAELHAKTSGDCELIEGDYIERNVGEYTITCSLPSDVSGHIWTDNTAGVRELKWKILPKELTVTVTCDKVSNPEINKKINCTTELIGVIKNTDVNISTSSVECKLINLNTENNVVCSGISLTGADKDNYTIAPQVTASAAFANETETGDNTAITAPCCVISANNGYRVTVNDQASCYRAIANGATVVSGACANPSTPQDNPGAYAQCAMGTGWNETSQQCVQCSKGTYSIGGIGAMCQNCPTGWTTTGTGAASVDKCSVSTSNDSKACYKTSTGYEMQPFKGESVAYATKDAEMCSKLNSGKLCFVDTKTGKWCWGTACVGKGYTHSPNIATRDDCLKYNTLTITLNPTEIYLPISDGTSNSDKTVDASIGKLIGSVDWSNVNGQAKVVNTFTLGSTTDKQAVIAGVSGGNGLGCTSNTYKIKGSTVSSNATSTADLIVCVYCARWQEVTGTFTFNEKQLDRPGMLTKSGCFAYEGEKVENGKYTYTKRYSRCCGSGGTTSDKEACYANSPNIENATSVAWTKKPGENLPYMISDVTKENCKASACYVNSDKTEYVWTTSKPTGYTKVDNILAKSECTTEVDACYVNTSGQYKWGKYKGTSGYTLVPSVNYSDDCKSEGKCYENEGDYIWSTDQPEGYVATNISQGDCHNKNENCYMYNGNYVWGDYSTKSGYVLIGGINEETYCVKAVDACYLGPDNKYHIGDYSLDNDYNLMEESKCGDQIEVPPTALDMSKIIYIGVAALAIAGIGFVYYANAKKRYE